MRWAMRKSVVVVEEWLVQTVIAFYSGAGLEIRGSNGSKKANATMLSHLLQGCSCGSKHLNICYFHKFLVLLI